ncbi:unnamed protein product [Enterobius vermicularis]|uniref:GRANULINS domain-containing protein n=1 Tax=Enterobius vermicularis TaxID=51028 RepID=A0A0N4VN28_ENTVE|nr:unnamed protein product [Enterobius vermicularis]
MESNDWPIGPPGYGFPPELASLDSVLVKATGDGRSCAAGFVSSLKCSETGECPPGLFCDPSLSLCCPLLLPFTDKSNNADHYSHPKRLSPKSYGSYPSTNALLPFFAERLN